MQEYRDGSFGEIQPARELAEALARMGDDELARTRRIHFGTVEQLEKVKAMKPTGDLKKRRKRARRIRSLEEKIAALEARLNEATAGQHTSGVRVYPATALEHLP